jgi:hypothetical protein
MTSSSFSSLHRLTPAFLLAACGVIGCTAEPSTVVGDLAVGGSVELPALAVPASAAEAAAAGEATAAHWPRPPRTEDPLFAAVLGHWSGECNVYLPGVDEPVFTVGVERISQPTANPDEITWTLIYHRDIEDVRNYFMRKDPVQPGRYLLDEKNGIVLTSYMHTDDLMINDFEGLGFRLRGREQYSRNRYDFEFVTSAVVPEITSDIGGTEFYAYQVISTQRCSMRRAGRPGGDQD